MFSLFFPLISPKLVDAFCMVRYFAELRNTSDGRNWFFKNHYLHLFLSFPILLAITNANRPASPFLNVDKSSALQVQAWPVHQFGHGFRSKPDFEIIEPNFWLELYSHYWIISNVKYCYEVNQVKNIFWKIKGNLVYYEYIYYSHKNKILDNFIIPHLCLLSNMLFFFRKSIS